MTDQSLRPLSQKNLREYIGHELLTTRVTYRRSWRGFPINLVHCEVEGLELEG